MRVKYGDFKASDARTPIDELKPVEGINKKGQIILTPDHLKILKILSNQEEINSINGELE